MLGFLYTHLIHLIFVVAAYLIWVRGEVPFLVSYVYLYVPTMCVNLLVMYEVVQYKYDNSFLSRLDKHINKTEDCIGSMHTNVKSLLDGQILFIEFYYYTILVVGAVLFVVAAWSKHSIWAYVGILVVLIGLIIYDIWSVKAFKDCLGIDEKFAIEITCHQGVRMFYKSIAKVAIVIGAIALVQAAIAIAIVAAMIFFKWMGEIFGDNE